MFAPGFAAAVLAGLAAGVVALAAGCGNQYRPVITPINPTGPASMPTAYVTVVSQPGFTPLLAGQTGPCSGTAFATPAIYTLMDFAGDAIVAQGNGGLGPLTFSLDNAGSTVYSPNCDGSLTSATATSNSLQSKNVLTSTLLPGSQPTNTLLANGQLYVTETGLHGPDCLATNCVAQMTGLPAALKQEIPVAPSVINMAGYSTAERMYTISQGNSNGGALTWGACANPGAVTVNGEADAIETITNTISARLPLGICPVYGFMTTDAQRTFIMNRGSGTVTVINSQLNALDTTNPRLGPNATIAVGAGPVFADYYRNGQVLVTANYDAGTISIIDVSLDVYGNDSATFGTVVATVPVGLHPVEVAVLQDGSRAYVANQGDINGGTPGSVSVVDLRNYQVLKTIPLTDNPHAIAAVYNYPIGKVYVSSQNSSYLTIIRTDTDIVSDRVEFEGNIVDMHVNAQYPGQSSQGASNYETESRSVGSGAP
jgi:DNA-binding beta-propeller fold protein YncE